MTVPYCLCRIPIQVHFADGSKAKVNLSPAETTSDLLEKDEVKENLISSASYLWMVDHHGNGKYRGVLGSIYSQEKTFHFSDTSLYINVLMPKINVSCITKHVTYMYMYVFVLSIL